MDRNALSGLLAALGRSWSGDRRDDAAERPVTQRVLEQIQDFLVRQSAAGASFGKGAMLSGDRLAAGPAPVVLLELPESGQVGKAMRRRVAEVRDGGCRPVLLHFDTEERAASEPGDRDALPDVPRLVLAATPSEFAAYGVDFRQVFCELTVRRLRADGVAVVAVLGGRRRPLGPPLADELDVGVARGPIAPTRLQAWCRAAAAFHQRHRDTDEIAWRLDCMTPAQPRAGNRCRVELDNAAARRELLDRIAGAEHSVLLQTYILRPGRVADELAAALVRQARAGVQVRILVDALWSGEQALGLQNPVLRGLDREPNVAVAAVDPVALSEARNLAKLKQRDHRKTLVVDGRVAVVSGRNVADNYYLDWSEVPILDWTRAADIPWLDAHVTVEGPVVSEIERAFLAQWHATTGQRPRPRSPRQPRPLADGVPARLVLHRGVGDANALASYEALIAGARTQILVVNDFPLVDRLAELLVAAVQRGVHVRYLTGCVLARRLDGTFFGGERYRELFEYVIKRRFGELVAHGVEVVEYVTPELPNVMTAGGRLRPYVHAKIVTADSRVASIGSANLDVTSSYWEREANLVIEDGPFTAALDARLQAMLDTGRRLDLDSAEWRREAAQREIVGGLWPDAYLS